MIFIFCVAQKNRKEAKLRKEISGVTPPKGSAETRLAPHAGVCKDSMGKSQCCEPQCPFAAAAAWMVFSLLLGLRNTNVNASFLYLCNDGKKLTRETEERMSLGREAQTRAIMEINWVAC